MKKIPESFDSWIQVYDTLVKYQIDVSNNELLIEFKTGLSDIFVTIGEHKLPGQVRLPDPKLTISVGEIKANIFDEIKHLRIHHFDAAYHFRGVFSKEKESPAEKRIFDVVNYLAHGTEHPCIFIREEGYYE